MQEAACQSVRRTGIIGYPVHSLVSRVHMLGIRKKDNVVGGADRARGDRIARGEHLNVGKHSVEKIEEISHDTNDTRRIRRIKLLPAVRRRRFQRRHHYAFKLLKAKAA